MQGTIYKGLAGVYEIMGDDGLIYSAYAAGKFRNRKLTPMIGDRVELTVSSREGEKHLINEILPRKNELVRPPVANVNTLLITLAVQEPNPDLMLADYLICYCRALDIEPVICINKSDLSAEKSALLAEQFRQSGLRVFCVSAKESRGLDALKQGLGKGIVCFAGQSAVGKSSLMNCLADTDVFETGGLSKKTERGRHTTRHCELIALKTDLFLADTPGFSLLELPLWDTEKLKQTYTEYAPYEDDCRFLGCNHVKEPDCAVRAAVERGELSALRYERYRQIFAQVEERWKKRYD